MKEIFKPIIGYENIYEISNLGNVKTLDRNRKSFAKGEFILKPVKCGNGYYRVKLCKNGFYKFENIHRLVAIHFLINLENKLCVNHIDGDKSHNYATNLEWCTHKENTDHAIKLGVFNPHIQKIHKKHKLTKEIVSAILKSNLKNKELALQYGLSRQYIGIIRNKGVVFYV